MTMVSEPLTVMFDLSAAGVGVEPAPGADLFSSLRVQPRATTAEIAKTARGRMLMVGTSVGWSLGWIRDRLVTIRRRMGNGATMRLAALDRAPPVPQVMNELKANARRFDEDTSGKGSSERRDMVVARRRGR